jgi:hypothetical protein
MVALKFIARFTSSFERFEWDLLVLCTTKKALLLTP